MFEEVVAKKKEMKKGGKVVRVIVEVRVVVMQVVVSFVVQAKEVVAADLRLGAGIV